MWPPTARRDCGQRRGAQRSTCPQRGTRHVGPASQQDAAGRHATQYTTRVTPPWRNCGKPNRGMGMRRGTLRNAGGEADADLLGTGGQNIATSITSS